VDSSASTAVQLGLGEKLLICRGFAVPKPSSPKYNDIYVANGGNEHNTPHQEDTMAATTKPGPVKGQAGVELQRGDKVRVGERAGQITGFTRDGDQVYVRFVEEGEGPIASKFPRLDVSLSS
jgi:hypothetical protein